MNLLTAAAATGILAFISQDDRLTGLLAHTSQGGIEEADFLILTAVVFARSQPTAVCSCSREIKEARNAGTNDREAAAIRLERTRSLVTAASQMLAVAIGAFATSKIVFLKKSASGPPAPS